MTGGCPLVIPTSYAPHLLLVSKGFTRKKVIHGGLVGLSFRAPGTPVGKLKVAAPLLLVFSATAKIQFVIILFALAELHVGHHIAFAPLSGVLEEGKKLLVGRVLQHIQDYARGLAGEPHTAIGIGTSVVQRPKFCLGIQTFDVFTGIKWTGQDTPTDIIAIGLVSLFLGDFSHQLLDGICLGHRGW